jgi:hypothetical protein
MGKENKKEANNLHIGFRKGKNTCAAITATRTSSPTGRFGGGESTASKTKSGKMKTTKNKGNSTQWLGERCNSTGVLWLRKVALPHPPPSPLLEDEQEAQGEGVRRIFLRKRERKGLEEKESRRRQ